MRRGVCVVAVLVGGLLAAGQASAAALAPKPGSSPVAGGALPTLRTRPGVPPPVQTGPVTDHGGPVQTAPKVYIDYWDWTGSNPDPLGEQSYLTSFLTSVGSSNWLYTVSQYSSASDDPTYEGSWSDTANAVPSDPTFAQIADEADNADAHFGIPDSSSSVNYQVIVALPPGVSLSNAGPGDCSYHSYADYVPYTALPYAGYDGGGCGENLVHPGSAGELDGVSIVEGHELAESITDPYLDGWYQTNLSGEIADKCVWYNVSDLITTKGTYPVQPLWSNATSYCTLGYNNGAGSWGQQNEISGQYTSQAPSLTVYGGQVYEAFKGKSSDSVYLIGNLGSTGWSTNYGVTGASTAVSPAVAVLNGAIYVLWSSSASPHYVYESSTSALGGSWTTPTVIGKGGTATSKVGPAVCSNGSDLYAVWTTNSDTIHITEFNGTSWGAAVAVTGAGTTLSPAIACTAGSSTETIVWTNSSDYVAYEQDTSGKFGGVQTFSNVETDLAPAATTFDGVSNSGLDLSTVVAWTDQSNNEIDYTVEVGSNSWGTITQVPQAGTTHSPTVAADADWGSDPADLTLYTGWEGASSQGLWYTASNTP